MKCHSIQRAEAIRVSSNVQCCLTIWNHQCHINNRGPPDGGDTPTLEVPYGEVGVAIAVNIQTPGERVPKNCGSLDCVDTLTELTDKSRDGHMIN